MCMTYREFGDTIPVLPHRLTDADVQRYRELDGQCCTGDCQQGRACPLRHNGAAERDYRRGMQMLAAVLLVSLCAVAALILAGAT